MSRKRPSTRLVKQLLFSRYGKVCMICGKTFDKQYLQCHHIIEFSKGGKTDVENCAICCANCHAYLHRGNEKRLNKQIIIYKETH